jgi:5-methylcytosine-specific restriction endonuclease McrA
VKFLSCFVRCFPHKNIHSKSGNPPPSPKKKYKKKNIPKAVKVAVWNTYIGDHVGKTKCPVCNINDITQMNFHCAHVVAEANGGATIISNLRPCCSTCNLSMRTMNLEEFKSKYFSH